MLLFCPHSHGLYLIVTGNFTARIPDLRAKRHHFRRQMQLLRQRVTAYAEQPSASYTYQYHMRRLRDLATDWLATYPDIDSN